MPIGIHRRGYQIIYAGIAPPPAPANLAITGASGGTVADLTPEATADTVAGATGYDFEVALASTGLTGTATATNQPTPAYTSSTLLNFTNYIFAIRARNAAGPGPWSAGVTVMTAVFVFLDKFNTDDAAPVADPLATSPAGDTWDVHDTGNKLSIASGMLSMSSSTGSGNPLIASQTNLKTALLAPGGCIAIRFRTGGGRVIWGISNNTNASAGSSIIQAPAVDLNNSANIQSTRSLFTVPFAQDNTWYWAFMFKRTAGYEFRIYGGIYTSPFNVFTIPDQTTIPGAATNVIGITAISTAADFDIDTVAAANMPSPFDTDTGTSDAYQASSTANDEIAMATNALVEWQFTAQTGVTRKLYVRYVDATHYIAVVCNQGASTLSIVKNEGSGESAAMSSVSWTWTNGTLYRVLVQCNAAHVDVMAATGSEWATLSNPRPYTDVAPENGGIKAKVSHDGSVFASWPLVRADIKSVIDNFIAATA